ncbi:MAG TPA: DUF58 domain-containing protein [Bryobacteraceae bacterium]|jgi:uncharacterized protein (DUF58 family)
MVPSSRLIWIVTLVGFPAAVAAGLFPAARAAVYVVLAAIVVLAMIDALLRRRGVAGLRVELLPALLRVAQDREAQLRVRVHNAGSRGRSVKIGLVAPEGIEAAVEEQDVRLPQGAEASDFLWMWTPRRRGRYRVEECFLEAASPLGMWAVRTQVAVAMEVRVYPNLRRDAALLARRQGTEGMHAVRQVGRGREFERLREYVAGDGSDEIHWKATARRGHPITKVYQVERTQEVYVVIDSSRLSARPLGDETALDRSIKTALILGAAAQRRGDLFGVAAFSGQVEAFVRARNGKTHYAACRDAINELRVKPISPDFDEIATFLRLNLRRRSLVLFLTSLEDPVLGENFARATKLLARRHVVLAGMMRPEEARPLFTGPEVESAEGVYRSLAGHLAWRKLRELEATLARQGVRLSMLEPETFSGKMIELYDEVKQRQLL